MLQQSNILLKLYNMAKSIDDEYLKECIQKGDEGSELLAKVCAPTLTANKYVRIIGPENRIALDIPEGYSVFVHSTAARPSEDRRKSGESLVHRLLEQAKHIRATPIAITDIIDSATGDTNMLREIAEGMAEYASSEGIAIINGENAILGDVVNGDYNLSGTMISIAPSLDGLPLEGIFEIEGDKYAHFIPRKELGEEFVVANSDGIGTKTRFYQRKGLWWPSVDDFLAMVLDDGAKVRGARVKVASGVIETNKPAHQRMECQQYMEDRCREMGILGTLQTEFGQLNAYKPEVPAYNIGGTAVSVVSEKDLENPLIPNVGDKIIAIRGKPNPRSNGITDKRKKMIQYFGENWHETEIGKLFLEYLAEPSTVLYPVFKELVDKGLATSVFHMSGGAYNGKFARPLAKHNRFAEIKDSFFPDWRELTLIGASSTSAEQAYGKFPMSNDGFITTSNPEEAAKIIKEHRLECRDAGVVYDSKTAGKTGLELKAYNGETVYFPGK